VEVAVELEIVSVIPDSSIFSTISKKTGRVPENRLFRHDFVTVGTRASDTKPIESPSIIVLWENK